MNEKLDIVWSIGLLMAFAGQSLVVLIWVASIVAYANHASHQPHVWSWLIRITEFFAAMSAGWSVLKAESVERAQDPSYATSGAYNVNRLASGWAWIISLVAFIVFSFFPSLLDGLADFLKLSH